MARDTLGNKVPEGSEIEFGEGVNRKTVPIFRANGSEGKKCTTGGTVVCIASSWFSFDKRCPHHGAGMQHPALEFGVTALPKDMTSEQLVATPRS